MRVLSSAEKMNTNETYPIDLITSYFAGEATHDDLVFLAEWMKADEKNRMLFESYRKTWKRLEMARIESRVDLDLEWNEINKKTDVAPSVEMKSSLVYSRNEYGNRFLSARSLRIAALIIVLLVPAFFLLRLLPGSHTETLTADIAMLEEKLPDGTAVTLNAGSTIEYPSGFKSHERDVKLKGEAWFEVTHDKSRPFIITAGKVKVRVLGTSFYVNTGSGNGKMEVILASGQVAIYYDNNETEKVILEPGEKADISINNQIISKEINDDPNYLAWKTKRLVFENTSLGEVTGMLCKVYCVKIKITNPELSQCRLTATFDNQTIGSVLNVIGETLNLRIIKNGDLTEISGNGCNK